jgi:hypothetical protein
MSHDVIRIIFLAAVRAEMLEYAGDGRIYEDRPFTLLPAIRARMNKSWDATRWCGLLGFGGV